MVDSESNFENRDRLIQLGVTFAILRKLRGMTQEQLAEKANISSAHLGRIESTTNIYSFSMQTFFNLADALKVSPYKILKYIDPDEENNINSLIE